MKVMRTLSVRITESLYQGIKDLAEVERRSIASTAILVIEQGLENYVSPGSKVEIEKLRLVR